MTRNTYVFMTLMFCVSIFNYVDRQILAILQEQIRRDLVLTDSQLGSLSLGFGALYALAALPLGRLADRVNRKTILLWSMAAWSAITAATGLAGSFYTLLLTRMGVAVGEAGVNPAAHSMIADRFAPHHRAMAIAIFTAGIPVGLTLAISLGGYLAETIGWRSTFVCFGVPGLLFAVAFYFVVAEPIRGESDGVTGTYVSAPLRDSLASLLKARSLVYLFLASTSQAVTGFAILAWMPSYYIRTYNESTGTVAMYIGPIVGVGGFVGMLGAAALAGVLGKRDLRWQLWIMAFSAVGSIAFLAAALLTSTMASSLAFLTGAVVLANSYAGISNALVQTSAPLSARGLAAAIKTVGYNLIGFGIGGQIVGIASDLFEQRFPGDGLRYGILSIGLFSIVAGGLYLLSARYLKADAAAAVARVGRGE